MLPNTNLSKTVFKFVSYKNALPNEAKEKYLGHIYRPKDIYGAFDLALDNNKYSKSSHQEIMRRAANNFCNFSFKIERDIDNSIFRELLFIGSQISKKEEITDGDCKILNDYYCQLTDTSKLLNEKGVKIFTLLWDNYIYHNIIQKDFLAKEAISLIIKAIHLGYVTNLNFDDNEMLRINGKEPLKTAIKSILILPEKLFPEEY